MNPKILEVWPVESFLRRLESMEVSVGLPADKIRGDFGRFSRALAVVDQCLRIANDEEPAAEESVELNMAAIQERIEELLKSCNIPLQNLVAELEEYFVMPEGITFETVSSGGRSASSESLPRAVEEVDNLKNIRAKLSRALQFFGVELSFLIREEISSGEFNGDVSVATIQKAEVLLQIMGKSNAAVRALFEIRGPEVAS